MITLTKRLRQESDGKPTKTKKEDSNSRVSIRDKLLVKEVSRERPRPGRDLSLVRYFQIQELEEHKPPGVKIKFDDPNTLHDFLVIISPEEGFWQGGKYKFHVKVGPGLSLVEVPRGFALIG